MKIIAKTLAGLEEVLAQEVAKIGATDIRPVKRAVEFEGDQRVLYRANMELRTALRILTPLHAFSARNETEFYKKMREVEWWRIMELDNTFAIDVISKSAVFKHSQFMALKTKDAIADQFMDKMNRRPNVDVRTPHFRINVHIHEMEVQVSLDTSGDSLHRRGYRADALDAPINEVLAAGMVQLSGWQADSDFFDAMCGSGTLAIEAALYAHNIPPQYKRKYFCFKHFKDFDSALFADVVRQQKLAERPFDHSIKGSDIHFRAVKLAENNVKIAGLESKIDLERKDFFTQHPLSNKGILMMNPPYDERLSLDDAVLFYKKMGDAMKKHWAGWQVWVISANLEAVKHVGLRPSRRIPLLNGKLECKLLRFDMY